MSNKAAEIKLYSLAEVATILGCTKQCASEFFKIRKDKLEGHIQRSERGFWFFDQQAVDMLKAEHDVVKEEIDRRNAQKQLKAAVTKVVDAGYTDMLLALSELKPDAMVKVNELVVSLH